MVVIGDEIDPATIARMIQSIYGNDVPVHDEGVALTPASTTVLRTLDPAVGKFGISEPEKTVIDGAGIASLIDFEDNPTEIIIRKLCPPPHVATSALLVELWAELRLFNAALKFEIHNLAEDCLNTFTDISSRATKEEGFTELIRIGVALAKDTVLYDGICNALSSACANDVVFLMDNPDFRSFLIDRDPFGFLLVQNMLEGPLRTASTDTQQLVRIPPAGIFPRASLSPDEDESLAQEKTIQDLRTKVDELNTHSQKLAESVAVKSLALQRKEEEMKRVEAKFGHLAKELESHRALEARDGMQLQEKTDIIYSNGNGHKSTMTSLDANGGNVHPDGLSKLNETIASLEMELENRDAEIAVLKAKASTSGPPSTSLVKYGDTSRSQSPSISVVVGNGPMTFVEKMRASGQGGATRQPATGVDTIPDAMDFVTTHDDLLGSASGVKPKRSTNLDITVADKLRPADIHGPQKPKTSADKAQPAVAVDRSRTTYPHGPLKSNTATASADIELALRKQENTKLQKEISTAKANVESRMKQVMDAKQVAAGAQMETSRLRAELVRVKADLLTARGQAPAPADMRNVLHGRPGGKDSCSPVSGNHKALTFRFTIVFRTAGGPSGDARNFPPPTGSSVPGRAGSRNGIVTALREASLEYRQCNNMECSHSFGFQFRGVTEDPNSPVLILKCTCCENEVHRWRV